MQDQSQYVHQSNNAQQRLHYALHHLRSLIAEFHDENCVIGGMHALLAHGLQMSREPVDLDLIIYNPTGKQLNTLKYFKHFDLINDRNLDAGYTKADIKAYKFKKGDLFLDIIVEHNKQTPQHLLQFASNGIIYKIQSIELVIAAKRSYFFEKKDSDGLKKYIRDKDALDMIDLKNNNFNL
jgi:hypothetical protein